MTENQKKPPPLHIPSYRWLPPKGECSDGKARKTSPLFTYSALADFRSKGECGEGKPMLNFSTTSRYEPRG